MPSKTPPDIQRFCITDSSQPQVVRLEKSGHYQVELSAPGVEVSIHGAWHAKKKEQITIHLDIIHQAPHTRSETLLRGVAQDSAQISFTGTIIVLPAAQHTNAFLTENILLLSDTAQAEAVPNLEIEAHEVKCSHAATITHINEEHLFYFQSRGIPAQQAKQMIVTGFLAGARGKNSSPLQEKSSL